MVDLADDLSPETARVRPQAPGRDRLDVGFAVAAGHRAAHKTERAPGVRREYFEPGQAVFHEGDRGDWLYVVTDGEVEVLKRNGGGTETSLRRLGPGECFGEIALVSDRPRTATVRAVTATNVLAVDREAFQALFATLPPLRGFVETLIAGRDR